MLAAARAGTPSRQPAGCRRYQMRRYVNAALQNAESHLAGWNRRQGGCVPPLKRGRDMTVEQHVAEVDREFRADTLFLVGIASIIAVVHLLTNGRYGFHRDELQVLRDARHLDWGFVPYPPLTPLVERVGLSIFGLPLVGLRMFSVIAQAMVVVVAGLMARELGGGRLAQTTGALAVSLSTLALFE